jgi:hypothetical protein
LGGESRGGGSCGGGIEQDGGHRRCQSSPQLSLVCRRCDVADADGGGAIASREVNFGGKA